MKNKNKIIIIILLACFLSSNRKESGNKVRMKEDVLEIIQNNDTYKKDFHSYPAFISIEKNERYTLLDSSFFYIILNCMAKEGGETYKNVLLIKYKNNKYSELINSFDDMIFQDSNYIYKYNGSKQFEITYPDIGFRTSIKSTIMKEDLDDRMRIRANEGQTIFSKGLHDISMNYDKDSLTMKANRFIYGFYHADIIGELNFEYVIHNDGFVIDKVFFKPEGELYIETTPN